MKHANIAIFIPHLGCPYRCIFCQQNKISHQGKIPSPSEIGPIIENALATIDPATTITEAAFFGGSFTALPMSVQKDYLEAVQPYLKLGLISGIRLSTRPDCISQSILDLLASRGVKTIELGVQSFDDGVLEKSGRGYNAEQVYKSCRLIKKAGFRLGIQLMIGLPGSSRGSEFFSTRMTIVEEPEFVRIYPALVIDDTGMHDLFMRGEYQPLSLEEAVDISKEMYLALQKKGISVVRMGLHPSEELRRPGTVVSGPYHPAFGELVMQAVFKEQAVCLVRQYISCHPGCDNLFLLVSRRELSKLLGWKKSNIEAIKKNTGLESLLIKPTDNLQSGDLIAGSDSGGGQIKLSRRTFLEKRPDMVGGSL